MPSQMAPAGMLQLQQRAAQGDPQAIQMLQDLGMAPPGMQGQQQPPMAPPQGGMSQTQFQNRQAVPPDVAAKRAAQLIKLLRERG